MTDLPSQTLTGFATWHAEEGFLLDCFRINKISADRHLRPIGREAGWRVVPVEVTITATGRGE